MLDEIVQKLTALPQAKQAEAVSEAYEATKHMKFIPHPGPQTEAYFSKADVLLFGGCVSGDTEYLTPNGWKRIDAYTKGDQVAQWAQDGTLTFAEPFGYTNAPCARMWNFKSGRLDMMLSDEHRVPTYDYRGVFGIRRAADLAEKISRHHIPVNFTPKGTVGIPLADDVIRLGVAIHADGHFEKNGVNNYCRVSLRKERKKERLTTLLTCLGIEWKEYLNPKRPTEVRYSFYAPTGTKNYATWWGATQAQLALIVEGMSHWDGEISGAEGGDIVFNTTVKGDAEFMQYAAHATGKFASISERGDGDPDHKKLYRVCITREALKYGVSLRAVEETPTGVKGTVVTECVTHRMYCFTTSTSFWVARRNGLIFCTSNSPGGGKTALECGLALNEHRRSMIVRKAFVDLDGPLHTLDNILGVPRSATQGNRPKYRDERCTIDFIGLGDGIGGRQGNPFDGLFIDEAAQLSEIEFRMLMGWLRTDKENQRCRVVLGSNPPLTVVGDWLVGYFAPWLNPQHHNPAQEGELRYFLPNEDGQGDRECQEDEFTMLHGVKVTPQSRSFISSRFTDNPTYDAEQYAKSLAGLPDEARGILMSGDFMRERTDDAFQAIPTAWVREAQARWRATPPIGVPMCAIGVDVAQRGIDQTVLAIRHDGWYAPLVTTPGKDTPDGKTVAGLVVKYRRNDAKVIVDLGGGWGGDAHAHLRENGIDSIGYMGVKASLKRTVDKQLKFFNVRSEAYWRFREALDPSQEQGSSICLPPDAEMVADLCAPSYEVGSGGIKLESKEKVCDRIKRSTDKGDAVAMAWWSGNKQANIQGGWKAQRQPPKVVMGHQATRR